MSSLFKRFALICIFSLAGFAAVAGEHGAAGGHDMTPPVAGGWSDQQDATFLAGMIVHHQGALKMAEAVVGATKDPDVSRWAKAILATQQEEIDLMQAILDRIGKKDDEAAAMMRKEMDEMLAMKAAADPDVNFVMLMVPHHAGAIDMAVPVLVMSDAPAIRKLAKDIIVAQATEIAEFREWLDKKVPND